jgi:hypothetical protein
MVDSLREGIWKYWNEYREEMVAYYKKGKIDFNHQDRIFPKIILEESLEIGKYTPFRVSNLYLGESISVSNNAFMNHNIKGQLYVTPLSGNYVTFYFDSSDEINFDDDCKIILSKKIGASEEEFLSADYYSVHKIKIASCRITK